MKMIKTFIAGTILPVLILTACTKKGNPSTSTTPTPKVEQGTIELQFDNKVDGMDLVLGSETYTNYNGDSYTVSKFNYYITNIRFNAEDGSSYAETESYHLVNEAEVASQKFAIPNVTGAKYKSITFMIGVDSLRNVSGAQTGELDPAKGNFWNWNSGYIHAKFEGNSPASSNPNGKLLVHIGGFKGDINPLKTVTLNFPESIDVNGTTHRLYLTADLAKWFGPQDVIDFSKIKIIHMPSADSKRMSDNFVSMFKVVKTEKQ